MNLPPYSDHLKETEGVGRWISLGEGTSLNIECTVLKVAGHPHMHRELVWLTYFVAGELYSMIFKGDDLDEAHPIFDRMFIDLDHLREIIAQARVTKHTWGVSMYLNEHCKPLAIATNLMGNPWGYDITAKEHSTLVRRICIDLSEPSPAQTCVPVTLASPSSSDDEDDSFQ
jgi:hypothetical protein